MEAFGDFGLAGSWFGDVNIEVDRDSNALGRWWKRYSGLVLGNSEPFVPCKYLTNADFYEAGFGASKDVTAVHISLMIYNMYKYKKFNGIARNTCL